MVNFKTAVLALLPLLALRVSAAVEIEEVEDITEESTQILNLAVQISTSFPQSEIFGVKLVNGHATQAVLAITNSEPAPITVRVIGGSLAATQENVVIRNLTAVPYNVEIPSGQNQSLTYNFATELHPQDLRLSLAAIVDKGDGVAFQVPAFNGTVSIVEAPLSIFDPQIIFLYLFLLSLFGGTCYFIYSTWIKTLFPQTRRGGKGGERAKTSTAGKKINPGAQVSVVGADGPAITSGSKYDASWIPAQHLQRPEAKRIRSGTPKTKSK